MCGSAELQVQLMLTMQTLNICAIVYIASKAFSFISIVAKYLLREVERSNHATCDCKTDKLEEL